MPVPWGLVVKNGSKTRSRFSAGIPSPVSSIEMHYSARAIMGPTMLVRIVTLPPFGVASSAFVISTINACSN